jgi:hypothetical protein
MGDVMVGQWLWAFAVCASLLGWGGGLARLLGLPRDPGSAACLGVAFAVCCGGLVNLLQIMSPAVAIGFVLSGALLAAVLYLPAVQLPGKPFLPAGLVARLLLAATLLLAALAIFGHVHYPDFNRYDDYSAYLVFPEKMLATGSLGFEPFSERRLLTGLGGIYFLQALVLAGADLFFLHVIDPALGLGLSLLLLETAMRRHRVVPTWRLGVLLFGMLLMPYILNLTAILLPVALMIFAYLLLETDPDVVAGPRSLGRIVALSLVGAALIAIKPAYLPWVGGFLAPAYLRRIVLDRFRLHSWREPIAIAAMTLVLLLPWMGANLRDVGTALYPVLGIGFHSSRYGSYPPVWTMFPTDKDQIASLVQEGRIFALQLLACGLIFALALRVSSRSGDRERGTAMLTLCFLLSGLLLVFTVAIGTALQGYVRYSYPGVAAAFMVALYRMAVVATGPRGAGALIRRGEGAAMAAACLVIVAGNAHGLAEYYGHAVTNLGMLALGPGFRPLMLVAVVTRDGGAEQRAILRMQNAIPAGAVFLERLDYPFLLDFRRNDVLVADWPGTVGPPPGMPSFQGPEKLAAYLLGTSVRYVAYAYGDEAMLPASERNQIWRQPWIQLDRKLAFDVQDNLAALMRTRRLVFKDDTRAVIDLTERVER